MTLPPFKLEAYFAEWEFRARYHLTASDAQTMPMADLLALADADDERAWRELALGYTETQGAPALRAAIASTYEHVEPDDVLVFAGPNEGITCTLRAMLDHDDHAVVVLPNYQCAETIPASLCPVNGVALRAEDDWALDPDAVAAALRPNTKVVAVNFPNNPTGAVPDRSAWTRLVELVADRGIHLFSDEIYRGVETDPAVTLPQAAELDDRAVSINGVSKAYGLPGLRIGWTVTRDRDLLVRAGQVKHYGSICSSAPSELLAQIAVKAHEHLFERTRDQIRRNLPLFASFFVRHADLFEYAPPRGGCVTFPRYAGPDGVAAFCRDAINDAGIMMVPAAIYASDLAPLPTDRFRIGVGRANAAECLQALDEFVTTRSAAPR